MKNIKTMSIRELIDIFEINITSSDFTAVVNNDRNVLDEFRKLRDSFEQDDRVAVRVMGEQLAIEQIMTEFPDAVNKEGFVLLTLYHLQEKMRTSAPVNLNENKGDLEKIKIAMQLIKDSKVRVIRHIYDNKGEIKGIEDIDPQELIEIVRSGKGVESISKPSQKQLDRMNEIDSSIGFELLSQIIKEEDFKSAIAINSDIGEAIRLQIKWMALLHYERTHPGDGAAKALESGCITNELKYKVQDSKEHKEAVIEAIKQDIKYINLDKLLLVACARFIELLESDKDHKLEGHESTDNGEEPISNEEMVGYIVKYIEEAEAMIRSGTKIEIDGRTYSLQDLENDLKRCIDGKYISKREIAHTEFRLIGNELTLPQVDSRIIRLINFSKASFGILIENSEDNLRYLIEEDIIGEEDIEYSLLIRERCSSELFALIEQKGILKYEEMLELFEREVLSSEQIEAIVDKEKREKVNSHVRESVRKLYLDISDKDNEEKKDEVAEKMTLFARYAALYKRLNLDGKSEEEISEEAFRLISSFEENISNGVLQGLYQFGLIPLESAADWGADLTEMLASNSIKPVDLKDLYGKQVISMDAIKNVLLHGNLSYEEKLDLIYSTFDGETETERIAREELIELLGIEDGHKAEISSEKRVRGIKEGTAAQSKQFITDPHTRWKLISLLDKDYSRKFLPDGKEVLDGHRVFLLPNHEKVVIERMHEKRAGKRVSAYGSATYIMDTSAFLGSMENIIVDGAINRTYLREMSEEGEATKIIHSKYWGDAIKRYFDIGIENERYTEDEIRQIDEAIKHVERSRQERE